jgi:hypothetical protein
MSDDDALLSTEQVSNKKQIYASRAISKSASQLFGQYNY